MAGKLVEEVKFLHAGEHREVLRNFGEILEAELKLPGQADYGMKCAKGITAFLKELQSVKDREDIPRDGQHGLLRAVVIYSIRFFQVMNTNLEVAKEVAEVLSKCLSSGYIAELSIDGASRETIDGFFHQVGVQRPSQAKSIDCSNYITRMDHGALTEAIYKQWFGPAAKLSDAFGGEAMDIDDGEYADYTPDAVRIIHIGLGKEDILKPLGRAFEDDVDISGQATYETYKKKGNAHPSEIIVKDMKNVRKEQDEQAHGVLMWDANLMHILGEKPEAKRAVEELLQQDATIPRQFANVLMKDIELSLFHTYSPNLYKILAEANRVVRLTNCLAKDGQSINFQDLARAVSKVWIGAQSSLSSPSNSTESQGRKVANQMDHNAAASPEQKGGTFTRAQQEPVESYDPTASTSSLELDMQDISEPSKTPPMHSVEQYGPASRGRSSDESSGKMSGENHPSLNGNTALPERRSVANGFGPNRQGITTGVTTNHVSQSRQVRQPSSPCVNSAERMVAIDSFPQEQAQKAQQNEKSLTSLQGSNERRLTSLDATMSEVALPGSQPLASSQPQAPRPFLTSDEGLNQKPASLRGPSLQEDEPQQPIDQPQVQGNGNANGINKFAYSNIKNSVPLNDGGTPDVRNAKAYNQTQHWSQPRRNDGEKLEFGRESLPTEAVKGTSAAHISATQRPSFSRVSFGTQTTSTDEGHLMTIDKWDLPRINNDGSLHIGSQSLRNQSASPSTHPTSGDDGHMPSAEAWNHPRNMDGESMHAGRPSLENRAVRQYPTLAQSDSSKGYQPPSFTNQKAAQLPRDPRNQVVTAEGGANAFQREDEMEASPENPHNVQSQAVGSQTQEPVRPISSHNGPASSTGNERLPHEVNSPLPSFVIGHDGGVQNPIHGGEYAMAAGQGSMFRKEDERDIQGQINERSDGMENRQPADGQNNSVPPQQQQQQQQNVSSAEDMRNQLNEKVGELKGEDDSRPHDAPPPYPGRLTPRIHPILEKHDLCHKGTGKTPYKSIQIHYEYQYKDLNSQDTPERSYSVPENFKYNFYNSKQEGLYNAKNIRHMKIPGFQFQREPVASVSGSSDSNSNSESEQNDDVIDRRLLKNLDPTCIQKMKIVLDPLKSIIADWRNLAGRYGVNNDTITYWRSKPEANKGPTEHLLEHLATTKRDLTVDEFKQVLVHYKRFDVLEVLKKQGY